MAVRLRQDRFSGEWTALCAAKHRARPGDVYIDNAQDHALRKKYLADYKSEGLIKEK